MDKSTALKILQLDEDASKQDAKKSYRRLAKRYHPDVVNENTDSASFSGRSMEDINLAFDFLLPLLPEGAAQKKSRNSGVKSKKKTKTDLKPGNNPTGLNFVKKKMQDLFGSVFRTRCCNSPKKKSPSFKPPSPKKSSRLNFDDIFLKASRPDRSETTPQKALRKKGGKRTIISMDNRYARFWALKKKMRYRRSGKDGNGGIGRIEKISPVSPVDPVRRHG